MASKLRKSGSSDEDCVLDMSPMIDMVFLLLIFFVVNSSAIVVKQDSQIEPAVAENGLKQEEKNGRIVVNVFEDGTYKDEMSVVLAPDDLERFIKEKHEANQAKGYKSALHLRGDKDTLFKHSRKLINASAKAGVIDVKFATYKTAN